MSSLDPTPLPLRRTGVPLLGALAVAAPWVAGCASTPSSTTAPAASPNGGVPTASVARALTYPDRLNPQGGDSMAMRWVDPSASFALYRQLPIEPLLVSLDADSSAVAPNDLKALTDNLDAYSTWAYAQHAFDRGSLDLRHFPDRHRAGATA